MKLENQVVSLELAKKLKELGVKQESQFYWRLGYSTSESFDKGISTGKQGHFRDYEIIHNPKPRYTTADVKWNEKDLAHLYQTEVSAFTVAELGEMIGKSSYSNFMDGYKKIFKRSDIDGFDLHMVMTRPDVGAKMLIYLLENKLINLT